MGESRKDKLSKAASALGRKGGSVKSEAKAAASRKNGKLGGRPKKERKKEKIMKVKRSNNNYRFEEPKCFSPNTASYPLCKGASNSNEFAKNDCIHCCLYENMYDDGGYSYYDK